MTFRHLASALAIIATLAGAPLRAFAQAPTAAALDAWLGRQMKLRAIPGMQVAVVKDGKIAFSGAYGVANLQTPVPVTGDTVFSINSATKSFTGVEILRLVERGDVKLEAPVSTYLGDLPATWRPITVRQLLTHMSGLPDILAADGGYVGRDEAGVLAAVAGLPLRFPPGERFAYTQTNYLLLRRIIEKARGRPFEVVVGDDAFKALGMSHSGFGDSLDVVHGKAESYRYIRPTADRAARLQNVHEVFPPFTRSAAGINSSAQDLARWLIALQAGEVLKPETREALWTPGRFNNGKAGQWANGWVTIDGSGHSSVGMMGGARSAFFVYPKDGVAVVILTNLSGANPEEMVAPIAARFIPSIRLTGVSALRERLETEGFDQAKRVAPEIAARDGAASLPESELNSWAYRLLSVGQVADALTLMKLIVTLYPQSGNAYDSLADVYDRSGDRANAVENYRRSLALDRANANAAEQLKRLQDKG
jgi:CubicO group peptidase (beta-lactamase class C family)